MSTSIALAMERDTRNMLRPFYRNPQAAFKEVAVLELYRCRHVPSGKAAELLGVDRIEFIRCAGRLGIPFFDPDGEDASRLSVPD